MAQPRRHVCLLSVSTEQRAEVAAEVAVGGARPVFVGPDPEWFLRRLREDGHSPVHTLPGPPWCGALATVHTDDVVLCLFDNTALTGEGRAAVLARHDQAVSAPSVFDDGVLRITRLGEGLRLAGELDVGNRAGLVAAMAGEPGVIDVRSLRFVDAGGVGALYSAARGRVRLRFPQPLPRRVIELFDPKAERLVCEGVGSG